MEYNLKYIDNVLATSSYIVGEYPSIADLSAFYEIEFLMLLDYDFDKWPNLSRWMRNMKGIKEVNVANDKFYSFAIKLKQLNKTTPKLWMKRMIFSYGFQKINQVRLLKDENKKKK